MTRVLLLCLLLLRQCLLAQIEKEVTPDYNFDENLFDFENNIQQLPENQGFLVILEPYRRTLLFAEVSSPVIKINKRMGDTFKEGDLLIKLDDDIFKSNYEKAKGLILKHQSALEAKEQLFKDKIASHFEVREAEADLANSKAELTMARKNLKASVIKAPYNGKVVELSIEEHELPRSGKELIEIVDDHVLLARFLIPSSLLSQLYIGKPIYIKLNNYDKEIVAKLFRIGSVIDPSSSLIKVEAKIDNKEGILRSGMTGTAYFIAEEERKKMHTPAPQPFPLPPLEEPIKNLEVEPQIKADSPQSQKEMNPE